MCYTRGVKALLKNKTMTKNIGLLDRIVRVVVGLLVVYWAVQNGSWLGLIGVVLLATATIEFCPLYTVFGIKTCPAKMPAQK